MKIHPRAIVLVALALPACKTTPAQTPGGPAVPAPSPTSVDLLLWEPSGVSRPAWPVTQGVPFPRGVLRDTAPLRLFDGPRQIPLETRVTSHWPDGSIRWLLADFQADIPFSAKKSVTLRWDAASPVGGAPALSRAEGTRPDPGVTVTDAGGDLRVDAGRIAAVFRPGGRLPFDSLACDGRPVLRVGEDLLTLRVGGTLFAARGDSVKYSVESHNRLHAVIRGDAVFTAADGSRSLDVTTRVHLYHGRPWIRLLHTIVNRTGGDVLVESMSLRLPLDAPEPDAAFLVGDGLTEALYRAENGAVALRVRTEPAPGTEKNTQDRAFRAEHGAKADAYAGVSERQAQPAFFLVTGKDPLKEEKLPGPHMLTLTTGAAAVSAGGLNISLHCRNFWPQAPKEIRADGRDIALHLIPDFEPPLEFWRGTAKTHEMILRVEPGPPLTAEAKEDVRSLKRFLIACEEPVAPAFATPHWIENSLAMGPVFRFRPREFPGLEFCFRRIHENALLHPGGLPGSTTLDFGCSYSGGRGGQWQNNEEDTGFALLLDLVRTGYPKIFWMAEPRIRHMIDVDTHHEAAEASWIGGQRYHSAKHGATKPPSVDHEWLEGPVYFWLLTGDERAREAAEARADHLCVMATKGAYDAKGLGRTQGWPLIALACAIEHLGHERYRKAAEAALDGIEKWIAEDGDMVYKQYETVEELGSGTLGQGIAAQGLLRYYEVTGSPRAERLFKKVMEEALSKLFSPEGIPLKNSSLRRNYYAPGEEAMTFLEPLHAYAKLAGRPDCADMARLIASTSFIQSNGLNGTANPVVYRFFLPYLGRAERDGQVGDVQPR
jgi:hypothetical protein